MGGKHSYNYQILSLPPRDGFKLSTRKSGQIRDRSPRAARSSDKIIRGRPLRGIWQALLSSLSTNTSMSSSTAEMELAVDTSHSPSTTMDQPSSKSAQTLNLLSLPAEIRISILEHVFIDQPQDQLFLGQGLLGGIFHNEDYSASRLLSPLLVCKQFYQDGSLLALNRTPFIISNLFHNIPQKISIFHPKQLSAIRSISFVADARHFRKLHTWGSHAFGIEGLSHLETLTIVLKRSSNWHYLFDFTSEIVHLLRNLQGVKKLVFVRNVALVKGSFKTWFNRLIGLILKIDHQERYEKRPPQVEKTWWEWSFDELGQSFTLEAREPKEMDQSEEQYLQRILPLMEELRVSMENEEWNPDPRSRLPYY